MSFRDIIGQDNPIQRLKKAIAQNQLAGAYLFSGPEGTGKKLTAKILAKAVNCRQENVDSCDSCASCLKIEKNQHPDVHFIDAGDSDAVKIEYIRQLQKEINLRSYEGKIKVFIIDNAHNLTAEASNALLKVLEEPPRNSLIILVSAKPALLFKTIISRCQVLKFSPMRRDKLEEVLSGDYSLNESLAHFLAYFSEGRLGFALRLKDTPVFIDKNSIIDTIVLPKGPGRGPDLNSLASKDKEEIRGILNFLAGWFRDVYLAKTGMPETDLIHLDRKAEILKLKDRLRVSDLDDILDSLSRALLLLEQNINVRLIMSDLSLSMKGS